MKKTTKDVLVVGFAMFAIFFGSGNLIFPPQIGLMSGSQVLPAVIGLAITGILFPMLAVASVSNVGYSLEDMMKHVTPWWHRLFMVMGILIVCFGTIPRCGGVSYEVGFEGIFGSLPFSIRLIYTFVFFAVSYYFAMNKSNVIDKIGSYLTPVLLVTLVIVIILCIIHPVDTITEGVITSGGESFMNAFKTGYNTGDVGTGILVAGMIISIFREKGYKKKSEVSRMMVGVIAIGFVLLFVIYAGLTFLGAQGTKLYPIDVDSTYLLTDLVRRVGGTAGNAFLSIAVIFACLTTAIGMIATVGGWIDEWSKGKLPYKYVTLVISIILFFVSSTGVSNVLAISGPLFTLLFPMCVVMTVLGLFKRFVPNDGAWKGAVIVSFIMAGFDALNVAAAVGILPIDMSGIMSVIGMIPLANAGFAWLVPTIIGFFAGSIYWKAAGKDSLPYANEE